MLGRALQDTPAVSLLWRARQVRLITRCSDSRADEQRQQRTSLSRRGIGFLAAGTAAPLVFGDPRAAAAPAGLLSAWRSYRKRLRFVRPW